MLYSRKESRPLETSFNARKEYFMGRIIQFCGLISFSLSQFLRLIGASHENRIEIATSGIGLMLMGIIIEKWKK